MGKPRVIAETGAGPARRGCRHRVRAARPRVRRLHGHRGHAPPAAERAAHAAARAPRSSASTPARARSRRRSRAAIRDWVTNVGTTHYVIGSCVGPAPYPAMVRDLQRRIGDEARAQLLERRRPAAGPRDRLRGRRLQRDRHLRPVRRRRRRRADRRRGGRARASRRCATRRRSRPARAACCTGRCPPCSRTRRARSSRRTRSRPGSTTRASGPSTPGCATAAGCATRPSTTARRSPPSGAVAELEGILPALESSHAVAWVLANPGPGPRPGHALRPRRQGPGGGARPRGRILSVATTGLDRIAAAFAEHGKQGGADAVPDGRLPRPPRLAREAGLAAADAGADLIELGHPVLGPTRRRPGDPRGRDRGAGRRCHAARGAGRLRAGRRAVAGCADGLRERGPDGAAPSVSPCGPRRRGRPG